MRWPVLSSSPAFDHLVVGVERAVEEHELGALQPFDHRAVEMSAAWNVEEARTRGRIADLQPHGVAGLRAVTGAGRGIFEVERDLAGNGKRLDHEAEVFGRALELDRLVERQLATRHDASGEDIEDGVCADHLMHAVGGVHRKRLHFAQMDQAGNVIDIAVGDGDRLDRAVTEPLLRA